MSDESLKVFGVRYLVLLTECGKALADQWAYGPFESHAEAHDFAQAHIKYYDDIPCIRSVVFMWHPTFAKIPPGIKVTPKKEPWPNESNSTTSSP